MSGLPGWTRSFEVKEADDAVGPTQQGVHSTQQAAKLARQAPSWTQTGESIGIRLVSQIQSIAGTLTRTQPCEAG